MNIVLYGASGNAGSSILTELVNRGHSVTAVSRHPEKIAVGPRIKPVQDDLSDVSKIAAIVKGADAVVSAYAPPLDDTDQIIDATGLLVQAIAQNGGPRLIVVGGAGGLFVAPGVTLHDSGYLPKEYLPISASHIAVYKNLQDSKIDWTYFAPAGFFVPGERTGKFRLDTNNLVADAQGNSKISFEDYAIALVDELEKPQHQRERFSIGY